MDPDALFDDARSSNANLSRRTLLKSGAVAAAAAAALPTVGGVATAHFPDRLDIDVRPRCDRNVIPTEGRGYVSVAVRYTEYADESGETVAFDPTERAERYRFGAPDAVADGGGTRPASRGRVTDVDGDGNDDLVLRFPVDGAGFDGDETTATLVWEEDDSGEHGLSGTDEVDLVGAGGRADGRR
ncbi:hypothetical protein [Halegenticoccus soli]|uniref:hypothetical protein n=1 Tax=Halegenticoccus soli TaxID=1985678 RepID=UPI000C6D137B|nr:hypothetical protein [Halegenticoccus soli]